MFIATFLLQAIYPNFVWKFPSFGTIRTFELPDLLDTRQQSELSGVHYLKACQLIWV